MSDFTLNINDKVMKQANKIAVHKKMTLNALLKEYLIGLADRAEQETESAAHGLTQTFVASSTDMGERKWNRKELHERR